MFLAEDTRQHNRKVALKVLPSQLTSEEGRVQRFKQEARAILALNHPNILTIFESARPQTLTTSLRSLLMVKHCDSVCGDSRSKSMRR